MLDLTGEHIHRIMTVIRPPLKHAKRSHLTEWKPNLFADLATYCLFRFFSWFYTATRNSPELTPVGVTNQEYLAFTKNNALHTKCGRPEKKPIHPQAGVTALHKQPDHIQTERSAREEGDDSILDRVE
jgi:hypothetical protein